MDTIKDTSTATPVPTKSATNFNFLDLCGLPIEGLEVRATLDQKLYELKTDAQGCLPTMSALPDTPLKIEVKRFDGSYKTIDECITSNSNSCKTYTSPALILEATTELHEGTPGDIENALPRFEADDLGVLETAEEETQPTTEDQAKPQPPVSDTYRDEGHNHPAPKPRHVHTTHLPDSSRVLGPITGAKAPLHTGRDGKGNPLVVYSEKVKDWWGRWSFTWPHFGKDAGASTTHGMAASATKVTYSGGMQDKVKALIETATALTSYVVPDSTATYLAGIKTGKKNLSDYGTKLQQISKGWCYKYVKMALVQSHVVDDAPGGESASAAGPELTRLGFTDVTATLPDARWAAAGDVIVYRWTDATWEKRKGNNPSKPNHGHIDIRSYAAYISDFIPDTKRPGWHEYTHIHIYRKVFDPLPTARMRAFLHCLREYECQSERDESKRYGLLNHPLPNGNRTFNNYKAHPWYGVPVPEKIKAGKGSTAAGAYQITLGTWNDAVKALWANPTEEKDLFSPAMQDRIAVVLLEGTKEALTMVRLGKTEEAVNALTGRWSSLPGGVHNGNRKSAEGKPMDMAYFMSLYNRYLSEEKAKEN
jgi:muramidase (phage lysozyme)